MTDYDTSLSLRFDQRWNTERKLSGKLLIKLIYISCSLPVFLSGEVGGIVVFAGGGCWVDPQVWCFGGIITQATELIN